MNPTPAVGDHVLVVLVDRAGIAAAVRVQVTGANFDGFFLAAPHFKWCTADKEVTWTNRGITETDAEGIGWARGWDDETAGALLAAWALRDQPQGVWGPQGPLGA